MNLFSIMRGFTIQTRMYSAIGVVLALLLCVGGIGVMGMRANHQAAETWQQSADEAQLLSHLHTAVGDLRLYEKQMVLAAGQPGLISQHHQRWQGELEKIKTLTAKLSADNESGQDKQVIQTFATQLATYRQEVETLKSGWQQPEATPGQAAANMGAFDQRAEAMMRALDEADKIVTEELTQANAQQDKHLASTTAWFVASVIVSILIVGPLTILNQISICRPIEQARQMAINIAHGDLGGRAAIEGSDEPAQMLLALNKMQDALIQIVGDVRRSADSISVASSEIASGNMDLSSRTESTASSLQETASSMQQLTETVRHSADSAAQANELASTAATAAERGNAIVSEVVANMSEIDGTSKRINDIISVIDGIAFQTNILALNAAVEAARAGEQGRGFAVVAGEVRSLAQRSATAAKEIKHLILASGEKVESGTKLVHDAGSAMQEILNSVQRVSNIIGEITQASHQQSHGIGQVNTAVNSLDQMTQQNAALVEQSAAAAASLKDQAGKLTQAMAVFKV
ncbi:MAG: methyl-accepting chemotaxis protein [Aquabacterium sp.]